MIKDNAKTWSNFEPETLYLYLKKSGLETDIDLKEIGKKIDFNSKNSILEIGPGTGRIFDYLIKNGFQGKLYAAEISDNMLKHIKEKYGSKITSYKKDVSKDFDFKEKFDLILWVWSCFIELSEEEQITFLEKAYSTLDEKGCLIIDSYKKDSGSNIEVIEGDIGYADTIHGRIYVRDLAKEEIVSLGEKSSIKKIEFQEYKTTTNRERVTYYFYK